MHQRMVLTPLDKAAFILYIIILVLSPLLFGAVHTYAYTIMSLGVLIGSLLLVEKNIRKDSYRFLVKAKIGKLLDEFPQFLNILKGNGKKGKIPYLWDGKAAGRMVEVLERLLSVGV